MMPQDYYELNEDKEGSNLACRRRKQFWVKKSRKKSRSTINQKLFVRDEAKLDRGRPWLYHSHISPFMDGEEMPQCLDLSFRPCKGMKFIGDELVVVAYIFGKHLDPNEILVPDDYCRGNRKVLLTLVPGRQLVGDVLTLVASMTSKGTFGLGSGNVGHNCWLPPTFFVIF
ncbi:hypothetical protein PIB30_030049 [Stylosanthes scabra]|uniref:Uncharacterized protein n=1 Tax=Stylosanthes scabra TaxID=79078 RepID=A0ABU6TB63_9FABA|nr:hypothetical protein [Stylosanthes scabra]